MKKGIVKQIDEMPYGEMTIEGLESIMKEFSKSKPKSNNFQFTEYCSTDQWQELRTGSDEFDRAMMKHCGHSDLEILQRDVREYLDRNRLSKDVQIEFIRCKQGYKDMTGEEYFYYNYCYINGKLPIYRDLNKEIFEMNRDRYLVEAKRKRNYLSKKPYTILEQKMREQPISPEECFRLKNKNL